jgi:hypothetical protein
MADVYGDLGGNPIELNNAATEATLKQLLAAMLAMGAAGGKGKGVKFQKEYEDQLKKLLEGTKKLTKATEDEVDAAREAVKAKREEIAAAEKNAQMVGSMAGAAMMATTKLTTMISSLANVSNSLSQAAASLNQIPVVGGTLAAVFGAAAGAAEKTYKSFQQAAEVGANFGGSITDMIDAASGAGLTFDQFSGIIARTGQSLALLGGSTSEGAKRLAQLGRGIKDTGLGDELARMGYSTEQINESMATYSGRLAKTGHLQNMNNAQLVESTGQYLKNLDAVSKLTGQSKKELEDARAQRMKDAQFRMISSKMDAKSQEELNKLMDSIPAEHREGMKEIIATGTATSEAGKAALAFLPETAGQMMGLNKQIRATGKMGADQAGKINAAYQSEAARVAKSGLGETLAYYGTDAQKQFMVGAMDAAARQKNLKQVEEERLQQEKKAAELAAQGLDPASLKNYQEQIAQVSNQFTKLLATSGLLEGMMGIFEGLVGFISTFLVPVFQLMGSNIELVGVALGSLAAAVLYTKTVAMLKAMADKKMLIPMALLSAKFVVAGAALFLLWKGLKWLWEATADFRDGLLSMLPSWMGGISKEEAAKRKKDREEAKLKEENNKATKESVDLKKEENKQTEKAVETANKYDFTSPTKLFESAARRAGTAAKQPGAVSAAPAFSGLGGMAARFESGAAGSSAVGWDSTGGTSYGKYQIATKTGTMDKFLEHLKETNPEAYKRLIAAGPADSGKNGAFAQEWKKLAGEGKLQDAEHGFIKKTHYDVGAAGVKDTTLKDMLASSKALQEVMWSTSVQHGGGGASQIFNKVFKPGMSEEELIKAVYAERATRFKSSTAQVRESVQGRFSQEQQLALGMVGQPGTTTPSSTQVASATAKTESKPATSVATAGAGAPGAGGAPASLNDVVASLQTLNMQMGQLIALNKSVENINQKQLSVQKSLSGDMFAGGTMGA